MKPLYKEVCKTAPQNEIRYGVSSWDDGSNTHMSMKYAWFDVTGKVCRGGEVPLDAMRQMFEVAVREGNLDLG